MTKDYLRRTALSPAEKSELIENLDLLLSLYVKIDDALRTSDRHRMGQLQHQALLTRSRIDEIRRWIPAGSA